MLLATQTFNSSAAAIEYACFLKHDPRFENEDAAPHLCRRIDELFDWNSFWIVGFFPNKIPTIAGLGS